MKTVKFSKMVATGNDFIVLDNSKSQIPDPKSQIAKRLCDRKLGIGADGLLLLEESKRADFRMRIFNPDGSEPEMCGNGSRCIAIYARTKKVVPSSGMTIETRAGILSAKVDNGSVKINMTEPKDIKLGIDIEIDKKTYQLHYINTGVPHAVCFVKEADKADVINIGRTIRYHKAFMPSGTNVDFVQPKAKETLFMRSYERGVETETFACGTGAVASAVISSIIKGFSSPVKVYTRGGVLKIYFKRDNNIFTRVFLEGGAREVFTGEIKIAQ